jgi:predicted nucleic acid-binding protein
MTAPIVVADTSILINFLKIDRMDLVGRYPGRFLATDHVESEVADDYPEQRERYRAAVAAGLLDTCSVTDPAEVALFLRLGPGVRLGAGECSAIAVALNRGYAIAIDDSRAIKAALHEAQLAAARLIVLRTQDVVVALIQASVLTMDEADLIKSDWEQNHRFRLKVRSFRDLI